MSEQTRDFMDLKREVVEARNQAIKTDNQVKNLTLDIKGFEKRFDGLEARARLSSVGINLLVALTIAAAAWFVSNVRIRAFEGEIAQLKQAVRDEHLAAQAKSEALHGKLAEADAQAQAHAKAVATAIKVLGLLDVHEDGLAAQALDQFDAAPLSELERRACERRFEELRQRHAVALWRTGRQAMLQGRPDEAVAPLQRVLVLDGNGRFGGPARHQLGWALWQSKRYEEAEQVLRTLDKEGPDGPSEEVRYLLGTAQLRLGKRDEGRRTLQPLTAGEGRFAAASRAYLQSLDAGSELPDDLPGGRVRLSRRLPGPQAPTMLPPAAAPRGAAASGLGATPGED